MLDSGGNVFVCDWFDFTIRKITPSGTVTTFAGMPGEFGSADGQGVEARFYFPYDLTIDRHNNLYVADEYNATIRKITPDAVVTTFAGSAGEFGYVDGVGSQARFSLPQGLTINHAGEIFVGDTGNNRVRKITPDGVVSTFAGSGAFGNMDGTGTEASFEFTDGLGVDRYDNIYVADPIETRIRKITPDAVVTHYTNPGVNPRVCGVALDRRGHMYVTNSFGTINRVPKEGIGVVFAGGPVGSEDGIGLEAQFNTPQGLAIDRSGNIYVADALNGNVRKVTPQAVVTTFAGLSTLGSRDAVGIEARFYYPAGVTADASGTVYVADSQNDTIRKIDPVGVVTTIAGAVFKPGLVDGVGADARFTQPTALAIDGSGNIYVADTANNAIRKISPAYEVTTLASGFSFNFPKGIAVDGEGNVFVADTENQTIEKITPAGQVTIFAGRTGKSGFVDGTGTDARFNRPYGIAAAPNGNLFVTDSDNAAIRKITPTAVVTTFAGGVNHGNDDGIGSQASFGAPTGIAADAAGNLYVTDYRTATLRKITPQASTTTLAGVPFVADWVDGTGSEARLNFITDVGVDGSGNVYMVEFFTNTVRKAMPAAQ